MNYDKLIPDPLSHLELQFLKVTHRCQEFLILNLYNPGHKLKKVEMRNQQNFILNL
jgi:hypothetical protein